MTNLFHDGGRSIRHIIEAVWWCGPASLAARPIWNDVGRRFEADEMGKDRKMVVVVEALGDSSISFLSHGIVRTFPLQTVCQLICQNAAWPNAKFIECQGMASSHGHKRLISLTLTAALTDEFR